jgi:hypothetical protein
MITRAAKPLVAGLLLTEASPTPSPACHRADAPLHATSPAPGGPSPCSRRKRGATWDPLLPQRQTNRNRSSVAATALQTPLGAISAVGPQVDEHDADASVPSA